ncbi:hypothetical protein GH714_024124 [Hevea brasiliensis]|uniref:6-phosphogluconate dehydrogenase NADP-binding domain-containing protein n=1 Tax=Hevea brasiliensis TaxID=3981 RepID=A0A6A6KNJ5_HEVBR|nr:hypothetical protein GH714_024124 [Hevea brasiliensis]
MIVTPFFIISFSSICIDIYGLCEGDCRHEEEKRRGEEKRNGSRVLGLGDNGKGQATNLIKSGFKVTVWNRTLSKCNELVELGASIGETPAAVVKKCELTIAILSDPAATLSVVFDKDGVLEEICNGKGYIDMSTVDPETSTNISKAITAKGGSFLEAPVSGSKQPAEAGQLVILAAGDKQRSIKSVYVALGKATESCLILYIVKYSMMNAFSEGLVLAERSGLNPVNLLDVLGERTSYAQEQLLPAFPLKHQQKDMRLALALGDENAVSMPVAAAANEAFKKARSMGLGDLDFSAVYDIVKVQKD